MLRKLIFFLFGTVALTATPASAALFSINAWGMESTVLNLPNLASDYSDLVQNPFVGEHHALLGPSGAHSYFDFSWTPDTASFLIAASHVAFDGNGGTRSLSSGNIYITPTVDMLLTATGTYAYDLPGWDMQVAYGLVVFDGQFHERFVQTYGDDTFIDGPTNASFTLDTQFVLPAGETSVLSYRFRLDAFDSTSLLATGSGDIQFTLQPIPEPSTVVLVFSTTLLSRRRSRIRVRCNNS
jgi:hypothetical protein